MANGEGQNCPVVMKMESVALTSSVFTCASVQTRPNAVFHTFLRDVNVKATLIIKSCVFNCGLQPENDNKTASVSTG